MMTTESKSKIGPKEYGQFMQGVDLENIYFRSASFELLVTRDQMPGKSVSVKVKPHAVLLAVKEGSFSACQSYDLIGSNDKDKKLIRIRADIIAEYSSKAELTEDIFDIFKIVNLPVNTWPYFREYVQSAVGRLNLPPLVLSVLKGA